ncbi:MAG: hypothetical protein JWO03_1721 [Bacteroidetes bacterium]|nr:hypothetical protein [Bacteroidota bacterium]
MSISTLCKTAARKSHLGTFSPRLFTIGLILSCIFMASVVNAQITVTGGAPYPTLKSAFDAINAGTVTGAVTISIASSTTEAAPAVLNASGSGAASYTSVNITSTGAFTILGSGIASGSSLVSFNGANNVTINGTNGLTISNPAIGTTAGSATISFTNDASNNTIQNCTILGSAANTTALAMGTIYFGAGVTTGNNSNTINNNTITAAGANLPTNAIYSAGLSTAIANSSNSITNNNVADYFNAAGPSIGLFIASNSSAWTITGNKFYQTVARTSTAAATHEAIKIVTASGVNYTVSNNVIGYATSSATGVTTYNGAFANRYIGIDLTVGTATASSVQNNTISGIVLSTTSGATTAPGIFSGIYVTAGNVNIGTTTGNTIGGTTGTGAISITGTTSLAVIDGIVSTSTGTVSIQNNSVGSITTTGAATIGFTVNGIFVTGAGNYTISSNTIGSATTANSITVGTSGTTTTGVCTFQGIFSSASGSTTSITNNTVANVSEYGTTGAHLCAGMGNTGACGTLTMTGNVVRNMTLGQTGATTFFGITNQGAVTTSITISNNQLGNSTGGLVTTTAAMAGTINGISNTAGTGTSALSISSNDFRGITHSLAASTAHLYINNTAATLSQTITNNTFTNLNVNTTGSVTFMKNDVALPSTSAFCTVTGNSIVTAFNKGGAGGTVACYLTTGGPSSVLNSTKTEQNNNFSNVTLTGATAANIWFDIEGATGGGAVRNISNNTFNNWTCGSSAVIGIQTGYCTTGSSISNNTITNISGTGAITGISINTTNAGTTESYSNNTINNLSGAAVVGIAAGSTGVTTLTISGNTINALTAATTSNTSGITVAGGTVNVSGNTIFGITSTTGIANGVLVTGGTTVSIFKNKIYSISATGAVATAFSVNGISVTTNPTTLNIYNNTIGSLTAASGNIDNLINGIYFGATTGTTSLNVYFNSILLSGGGGALFGSNGIYHTFSTTATSSKLDLRNNIIINNCTPSGAGFVTALRRSATTNLNNYATTSNNNIFYTAGAAATPLYYDGTTSYLTLATLQAGLTPRETVSGSENTTFQSTTGSNANFLRIAAGQTNFAESHAAATTTPAVTDDYWGITRPFPSPTNGGVTYDIGASEFDGIPQISVPTITSVTPASLCPGASITINGTNLSTATAANVKIGGTAVASITTISPTQIVAVAGAGTTGFVTVNNGNATTATSNPTSITVFTPAVPSISPGSATYCGTAVTLTASGSSTYVWSNGGGSAAAASFSPAVTTTYTVTSTDVNTCTATASRSITYGSGLITAVATATPTAVCSGSPTTLSVVALGPGTVTQGAGASTTSGSGGLGSTYVSPFTHYYGGFKGQYMLRASELSALGLVAGNLSSLSLYVTSAGTSYAGFAINIAQSGATDMSAGFSAAAFTQVYTGTPTPTVGVNAFPFSTAFNWDGTSNIIVQICWSNNNTGGTACEVTYDNPGFVCEAYYRNDNYTVAAMCGNAAITATTSSRPRMDIVGIKPITPSSYAWSAGVSPSNAASGTANPTVPTSYTCSVNVGVCTFASNSAAVSISSGSPSVTLAQSPNTAITSVCPGSIVTLTPTVTGGCGPFTYAWSAGTTAATAPSVTVTPSTTTTYTVTVTDNNSQTASTSISVNTLTNTVASISPSSATYCGTAVQLTANPAGATSYAWSGSGLSSTSIFNPTATPTTTTTYTVTVTAANTCTSTASVVVTRGNIITLSSITANPSLICSGNSSALNVAASIPSLVASYSFAKSTGTYAAIGGTTSTATGDDGTQSGIALPFTFAYHGTVYTTFSLTTNGAITLGVTAPGTWWTNSLATKADMIGPLWDDNYLDATNGSIIYGVSGTTPNQVFTIQWTNDHMGNGGDNTQPTADFQIKLFETSNVIQFVYGSTSSAYSLTTASIGLSGAVGDFLSVTPAASATTSSTTENTSISNPSFIPSGTTYTFTPPAVSPLTYAWSANTSPSFLSSTSISNPNANSVTATRTYTVTVSEAGGCNTTGSVVLTVSSGAPSVSLAVSPTGTVCTGTTVTLTPTVTGGCLPYSYSWSAGTTPATGTSVTAIPGSTTTYTVTVTDGGSTTATAALTVNVNNPTITGTGGPTSICGPGTVNLTATVGTPTDTAYWYLDNITTTSIGKGPTFTTPTINATTTFYVGAQSAGGGTVAGGKITTTGADGGFNIAGEGLVFNATSAFTLASVDMYPQGASTVTIQVQNSSGTPIAGLSANYTFTGATSTPITVPLGFSIPVGTGYRLILSSLTGSVNFWRDLTASYPYALGTVGSVTSGYISGTSGAYYFFYNLKVSSGCSGSRTPITVTYNTPPSLTVSPTSASICSGDSVIVTGSADPSYTTLAWTPTGTVTPSNAVNTKLKPTNSTDYLLTATGGGCTNSVTVHVDVKSTPTNPTVVPGAATLCAGQSIKLRASGSTTSQLDTLTTQNFNSGLAGWTVTDASYTPTTTGWKLITSPYNYYGYSGPQYVNYGVTTPFSGFIIANADTGGINVHTTTLLNSITFPTTGYTTLKLYYKTSYMFFSQDTAWVQVSADGGATWTTVKSYTAATAGTTITAHPPIQDSVDISTYVGNTNVQVRFFYGSGYGYSWSLDNIFVTGLNSTPHYTWSPPTGLWTNSGLSAAYVGGAFADSVYASPSATTLYTTQVTNPSTGCFAYDTTTVSVNNPATAQANTTPTASITNAATYTLTGSATNYASYSWSATGAGVLLNPATLSPTYDPAVGQIGTVTVTLTVNAISPCASPVVSTFVLTVTPAPNNVWIGNTSDWFTVSNWASGVVPNSCGAIAIIPALTAGFVYPVINATSPQVGNLSVASGASVTINSGKTLSICGTWTGGSTTNANILGAGTVIINGTTAQTMSGKTSFNTLNVNKTAGTLTINGSQDVHTAFVMTQGNVVNNPSTNSVVTLKSDATGTAYMDNFTSGTAGTYTGNLTVERYTGTNTAIGYRDLSSPVNARVGQWSDNFLVNGLDGVNCWYAYNPYPTLQYYNESANSVTANYYGGFISTTDVANILTAAKGYAARLYTLPVTINTTGAPNNGAQSIAITKTTSSIPSADGWNLVGNPYPSSTSWNAIKALNVGKTDGSIYRFVSTGEYTGNYATWNGTTGTNGATDQIASTEGFWILASATNTLNMNNTVRVASTTTPFFKTYAAQPDEIRLTLTNGPQVDEIVAYTDPAATAGYDPGYDAAKMAAGSTVYMSYDMPGKEMAINVMDEIGILTELPLNIAVTDSGAYTLTATELNLTGLTAYLKDAELGTYTDLSAGPITLTLAANRYYTGRYSVVFKTKTSTGPTGITTTTEPSVKIYAYDGKVYVVRSSNSSAVVNISNLLGQQVADIRTSEEKTIIPMTVTEPWYALVKVTEGSKVTVEKVLISNK